MKKIKEFFKKLDLKNNNNTVLAIIMEVILLVDIIIAAVKGEISLSGYICIAVTGADVLKVIASAPNGVKLRNDYDFSRDSLFCEWAYVIDFDKNTFEVYQGFNEKPLDKSERFYSEVLTQYSSNNTYY